MRLIFRTLTPEFLKETWKQMNRRAASGIDGETMEDFGKELDRRVEELVERLKSGNYKAPVIRRVVGLFPTHENAL